MKDFKLPCWWTDKISDQNQRGAWKIYLEEECLAFCDLFKLSELQDPSTIKYLKISMYLALDLISEQGTIDPSALSEAIEFITKRSCPLYPRSGSEYLRIQHILKILGYLKDRKICMQFEKTQKSINLSSLDQILINTLKVLPQFQFLKSTDLSDRHAKIALLSGWLVPLRQTVGSCFATAPAIVIQAHQPLIFLADIQQILSQGQLKRIVAGKEVSVPCAENPGMAELNKTITNELTYRSFGLLWSLYRADLWSLTDDLIGDLDRLAALFKSFAQELLKNKKPITPHLLLKYYVCHSFRVTPDSFDEFLKNNYPLFQMQGLIVTESSNRSILELCNNAYILVKNNFFSLTDHSLLRIWEFTLASFSDTRQDFCQWSLQTSLGMNFEQKGSLAQCLYQILTAKVEEYNLKSKEVQEHLESMNYQVQHVAIRMQNTSGDHELIWLRSEYQTLKAEVVQLQLERDQFNQKAHAFANLFNQLLDYYIQLFGDYFQQVYDPQMCTNESYAYEDSPAGFRLVFKGGRLRANAWSLIRSSQQFIESVVRFLTITEYEMMEKAELAVIKDDFSHIVTLLVQHVRSREFLKTSIERMANSLSIKISDVDDDELEKAQAAPWAYISGGSMRSLLSHYYGKEELASQKESWFHNLQELWVFLIDTMRDMPESLLEPFLENPQQPLLMHSSNHAFSFLPMHKSFVASWNNRTYPYTWIRDHYLQPVRDCYYTLLSPNSQKLLLKKIKEQTGLFWPSVSFHGIGLYPHDFRNECLKEIKKDASAYWMVHDFASQIDSILIQTLPILDRSTFELRCADFCDQTELLSSIQREPFREILKEETLELSTDVAADEMLTCFYKAFRKLYSANYTHNLSPGQLLRELNRFNLCAPVPIFFADTNWDYYHFAFVLNPGSDQLELWRFEPDSFWGMPMSSWKDQFQENANTKTWAIFNRPDQYSFYSL
jgi:hypothetical protein